MGGPRCNKENKRMKNLLDIKYRKICEQHGLEYIGFYRRRNNEKYVSFICPNHRYRGIQERYIGSIKNSTNDDCGCYASYYDERDFLNDNRVNKNIEFIGNFIDTKTPISCKCKVCGYVWSTKPSVLMVGHGCPKCAKEKTNELNRLTQNEFNLKAKNNTFLEVIGEYINWISPIKVRCKNCRFEFEAIAGDIVRNRCKCPVCGIKYKNERRIANFLNINNVKFIYQYNIYVDCKKPLKFDFFIPEYNIAIEYHGEQHYIPVIFSSSKHKLSEIELLHNQYRDNLKRNYCIEHNIMLIEIPYWEKNNIEIILEPLVTYDKQTFKNP